MRITDVKIKPTTGNGNIKATASITIDDAIAIHNIRIMEGSNGLFLSMPSRKGTDGKYWDIAHPVSADARSQIYDAVFAEYKKEPVHEAIADEDGFYPNGSYEQAPFDDYRQRGYEPDEWSL